MRKYLGQLEDFASFDPSGFDTSGFDPGAFDAGAFDFGTLDTTAFDTSTLDANWFDPGAGGPDFTSYGVNAPETSFDFTAGTVPDVSVESFDWNAVVNETPPDATDVVAEEIAAQIPDVNEAVSMFSVDFPEIDWGAVQSLAKSALDVYKVYAQASAQRGVTSRNPTLTAAQQAAQQRLLQMQQQSPTTRTVTDPRTGKPVTLRYDAATGKWVPVGQTDLIPGVPNWALIAGAAGIGLLLLTGRKPRGR